MLNISPWTYIAFDESNHGKYPEIDACVFSSISQDIKKYPGGYYKKRRLHSKTPQKFR